MQRKTRFSAAAAMLVAIAPTSHAVAATEPAKAPPKEVSNYVKCDGFPNNQTGAETVVRMVAAAGIIGLLAPKPEAADPSKRKLGAEGVAACDLVLSGEKAEANVERRIALLLGRAIHQIEAKNYAAAIADVGIARREAQTAGLMNDPYFVRSRAVSFDQIEAAALVRLRRFDEADAKASASFEAAKFSLPFLLAMKDYADFLRENSPSGLARKTQLARLVPVFHSLLGSSYMDSGRFVDAARIFEDWISYNLSYSKGKNWHQGTYPLAAAALAHGLAGDWDMATKRAAEARANSQKRVTEGNPEQNRSDTSEMLDLFDVLKLAKDGNLAGARRMFTGRSQWLEPPLGAVMEVNNRLRPGAMKEDLIGPLAKTADQMWEEQREAILAQVLAKDGDNKTLFALLTAYAKAGEFETMSAKVWKIDKSKILIKPSEPVNDDQIAYLFGAPVSSRFDAYLLHTALMARKDGKRKFLFMFNSSNIASVFVRMGNAGDPTIPSSMALDVDEVIAGLSPIIPDPVVLKARRAAAPKN